MRAFCILEQHRLNEDGEMVPVFTLVENPIRGIYRELTMEEARRIIEKNKLMRYPCWNHTSSGTYPLGAVWDSRDGAFKSRYSPRKIGARILRHCPSWLRVWKMDESVRARFLAWLGPARGVYKDFLHRKIDLMFNHNNL